MIMNKKELEKNIETANEALETANEAVKTSYKDLKIASAKLDNDLNIRNAALAFRSAAFDNYHGGSQNDTDAYILARDNYNAVCYWVDKIK